MATSNLEFNYGEFAAIKNQAEPSLNSPGFNSFEFDGIRKEAERTCFLSEDFGRFGSETSCSGWLVWRATGQVRWNENSMDRKI